jgi:hypothetical protein
VNPYQGGYARDAYFLPILGQPERTLTPVPTYTPIPACFGTVSASTSVNIRVGPGQAYSTVRQAENGDILTIIGKVSDNSWFKITSPNTDPNWINTSVLTVNLSSYPCQALPLYDFQGIAQATYTPSPTRIPSATPTLGPSPTRIPRNVVPEAQLLHDRAREIGLPLPFDTWPVADYSAVTWKQGYGPTSFAKRAEPPPYRGTHQIHSGIDFTASLNQTVISVCSGVVVGGSTTGQYTGYGVSVRCFADDSPDVDGDNIPNLSNIVVSYNHLRSDLQVVIPSQHDISFQVVSKGQILGYTASFYYSKGGILSDIDSDGNTYNYKLCYMETNFDSREDDCRIINRGLECIDLDATNECTTIRPTADHLHLEVFIARGLHATFNAIRVNPLLMFDINMVLHFTLDIPEESGFDTYFPVKDIYLGMPLLFDDTLGVASDQINSTTQQGSLPDRDRGQRGFFRYKIQIILFLNGGFSYHPMIHAQQMKIASAQNVSSQI